MGRHCGYLALVAGIVCEADFIFIPEWPPEKNWPEQLCTKLSSAREEAGQRLNIIMVAEGAIDREGNAITCEMVKKVVVDNLHQDTRITVLGHIQRGGAPSAFDRVLGCRLGAEAVMALMDATPETEPCIVSLTGNTAVRVPLVACVEKTQAVGKAMANQDWDLAIKLRGRCFQGDLATYRMLTKQHPSQQRRNGDIVPNGDAVSYNLAVMCIGEVPAPGMNAAVRSFVRNSILGGHTIYGIRNSFEGFIEGDIFEMTWGDVTGWVGAGGAHLGTNGTLPDTDFQAVANHIRQYNF